MTTDEVLEKLRALEQELCKGSSPEELIAAQLLATLGGAICEGGEPLRALSDFAYHYSLATIERCRSFIAAKEGDHAKDES